MTLAKVKEQDGMMLVKVKEQDGMIKPIATRKLLVTSDSFVRGATRDMNKVLFLQSYTVET